MKRNLYYYFNNKYKEIKIYFLLNWAYCIAGILLSLIYIIFDVDEDRMAVISISFYSNFLRITFLFIYVFLNILRFLYAFFYFRGINFKYWIWDIFNEYKISHLFSQSSFFIVKNKLYREKLKSSSFVA